MTCGYCGGAFAATAARTVCERCPLGAACRAVRCPLCGYEAPEELGLWEKLRRWSGGSGRQASNGQAHTIVTGERDGLTRTLARMLPGESGTVVALRLDDDELSKLLALGVLPGSSVTLLRRSPSFVFEIDYSQLTVDRRLAEAVLVRSGTPSA